MIRINDDWVIDVDAYNYVLKKDMHRDKVRKDGTVEHVWDVRGYFSGPEKALKRLREEIIRDELREAEIGLPEAVTAIQRCTREWSEIIERIMKA